MVCELDVSPIVPSSKLFCPASPSLQWVPWASVPHLLLEQLLPRSSSVLCSATTAIVLLGSLHLSLSSRYLACSLLLCVPLPARWMAKDATPAPGLLLTRYPFSSGILARRLLALTSSRATPLDTCPAPIRPRWSPGYLPFSATRIVAFRRMQSVGFGLLPDCSRGYPIVHDYTHFGAQ